MIRELKIDSGIFLDLYLFTNLKKKKLGNFQMSLNFHY